MVLETSRISLYEAFVRSRRSSLFWPKILKPVAPMVMVMPIIFGGPFLVTGYTGGYYTRFGRRLSEKVITFQHLRDVHGEPFWGFGED